MTTTISLVNGAESITINTPEYGYVVDLYMSLHYKDVATGKTVVYDDTASHDYRVLTINFLLNKTDHSILIGFLNSLTKGRGEAFNIQLGSSDTGFYPGGPDRGSVGTFGAALLSCDPTTIRFNPYKFFSTKVVLKLNSYPAYSLPSRAGFSEGDFSIKASGRTAISNLNAPQDGFNIKFFPGIKTSLSQNGNSSYIEMGILADQIDTTFTLSGNQQNMAAVINEICSYIRGTEFLLTSHTDVLPFGIEKNGLDCNGLIIDNKISIKHQSETEFMTTINARLNSTVTP